MCAFACRAFSWFCKAFSLGKLISACLTSGRDDDERLPVRLCCMGNMGKMGINFLFADSNFLGQVDGGHFHFT